VDLSLCGPRRAHCLRCGARRLKRLIILADVTSSDRPFSEHRSKPIMGISADMDRRRSDRCIPNLNIVLILEILQTYALPCRVIKKFHKSTAQIFAKLSKRATIPSDPSIIIRHAVAYNEHCIARASQNKLKEITKEVDNTARCQTSSVQQSRFHSQAVLTMCITAEHPDICSLLH